MGQTFNPTLAWNRWTFLKINGDVVRYRTARISMDVLLPIHTSTVKDLTGQKAKWHKSCRRQQHSHNLERNAIKYTDKFEQRSDMTRSSTAVLSDSLWCTDRRVITLDHESRSLSQG